MTLDEQKATFEAGVLLLQHQNARIAQLKAELAEARSALEAEHQKYTGAVIQLTEARKDSERLVQAVENWVCEGSEEAVAELHAAIDAAREQKGTE